jgi:hypothetical protein
VQEISVLELHDPSLIKNRQLREEVLKLPKDRATGLPLTVNKKGDTEKFNNLDKLISKINKQLGLDEEKSAVVLFEGSPEFDKEDKELLAKYGVTVYNDTALLNALTKLERARNEILFNEQQVDALVVRARLATNNMHGVYNRVDKSFLARTLHGSIILGLRNYFFATLQHIYVRSKLSLIEDSVIEGATTTFLTSLAFDSANTVKYLLLGNSKWGKNAIKNSNLRELNEYQIQNLQAIRARSILIALCKFTYNILSLTATGRFGGGRDDEEVNKFTMDLFAEALEAQELLELGIETTEIEKKS